MRDSNDPGCLLWHNNGFEPSVKENKKKLRKYIHSKDALCGRQKIQGKTLEACPRVELRILKS